MEKALVRVQIKQEYVRAIYDRGSERAAPGEAKDALQFTRGTFRKLLGYVRYDSPAAQAAMQTPYRGDLRLFENVFLPPSSSSPRAGWRPRPPPL